MDGNGDVQPFPISKNLESSSNWGSQAFISMDGFSGPKNPSCGPNISKLKGYFNTPLEHTPKPLPTGYKGIPFIVG